MDIQAAVRPSTVYLASDPVTPRWLFLLSFTNQSTVDWTLEACTVRADPPRPGAEPLGRAVPITEETLRGKRTFAPGGACRLIVYEAEGAGEDEPRLRVAYTLVNGQGARVRDSLLVPLVPRQTLALDFPLDGRWIGANVRSDVHALGTSFAFDFVVEEDLPLHLNQDPRVLQPHEFASYGRPLYSPMDGRVVLAESDQPDLAVSPAASTFAEAMAKAPPTSAILGNFALIQGADGACVLMAHMQRGSARIQAGDPVSAGQPIGLVGNSGNSTGAHLHIEVLDGVPDLAHLTSPTFTQSGVPFGFRNARVTPAGAAMGFVVPKRGT